MTAAPVRRPDRPSALSPGLGDAGQERSSLAARTAGAAAHSERSFRATVPRSIRIWGEPLPSRSLGVRWISFANSENRSGLARRPVLRPEVSIQTSHAYQEDRPHCPTCLHLTSIASAVSGHVCPLDSHGCCPGASRAGANVLTEPDSWPCWRAVLLGGPDDFRLLVSCPASSRRRPPPPAIRQVISIGVVIDAHLPSGLVAIVKRGTCSCQDRLEDL